MKKGKWEFTSLGYSQVAFGKPFCISGIAVKAC